MLQQRVEIEFHGGPYDGHKELRASGPVRLPTEVAWFVCADAFRLLDEKDHRPGGCLTSVALFELEISDGALRYRFASAMSVRDYVTLELG